MRTLSILQNQTFLFTGTLAQFTRDEAEALVKANGGKLLSKVSAKLNYLVVGDDAGSKLEKAKKLSTVRILTENEFLKMISNGTKLPNGQSNSTTQVQSTSSIEFDKPWKKSKSETNTRENKELIHSNLPNNDTDNSINFNRIELSNIKKLLTSASIENIDAGLLMVSSSGNDVLIDTLLKDTKYLNGELVPNSLFKNLNKHPALLNYSVLSLLGLSNEKNIESYQLKCSIKELKIDLPNLSPLRNIKTIEKLILSDSLGSIMNLDALSELTQLRSLHLKDCLKITNINGLQNLPIEDFDFGESKMINSFSPLIGKKDSTSKREISILHCDELLNLDGIEFYHALNVLSIYGCKKLKNVKALANFKKPIIIEGLHHDENDLWSTIHLQELNSFKGIDAVEQYDLKLQLGKSMDFETMESERIKFLSITCNNMSNLDWVKRFPSLIGLSVECDSLIDISALAECTKLIGLILKSSAIHDFNALSSMTSLAALNISNCSKCSNINFLYNLKNLKLFGNTFNNVLHLEISSDTVTKLSFSNMPLVNDWTPLFDIHYLKSRVFNMKWDNCNLKDFQGFEKFKNLSTLVFYNCKMGEIDIATLSDMANISELKIENCNRVAILNNGSSQFSISFSDVKNLSINSGNYLGIDFYNTIPKLTGNISIVSLKISDCKDMVSLDWISANTKIDLIEIHSMELLNNVDSLKYLKRLNSLSLFNLPQLTNLSSIIPLAGLESAYIEECDKLEVMPKPKGLMNKENLMNYRLHLVKFYRSEIPEDIAEKLNDKNSRKLKSGDVSRKEISNIKKLLLTRDIDIIASGVNLVASLNSEYLFNELLDGIEHGVNIVKPNRIFAGSGPAQPYLNTAMLGILDAAAGIPKWREFISQIVKLDMEFLILDYVSNMVNLNELHVVGISVASKKLDTVNLRYFYWNSKDYDADLPALKQPINLQCFENCSNIAFLKIEEEIDISGGLDCLKHLPNLISFKLSALKSNDIDSFQNLAYCSKLVDLTIHFNRITSKIKSLSGIENLHKMKKLSIVNCELVDTSALKNLCNIESIQICSPTLEEFTPCLDFKKLLEMNFSDSRYSCNKLKSIGESEYPENMNTIDLSRTAITEFPKFKNLKNLEKLDATNSRISSFTSISDLKTIENLTLGNCHNIKDFIGFEGINKISEFYLGNCSNLISFNGFQNIETEQTVIDLSGCIALKSLEHLPIRCWDKVTLYTDELPTVPPDFMCIELFLPKIKSIKGIGNFRNILELKFKCDYSSEEHPLEDYSPLCELTELKDLIICVDKPLSLKHIAHLNILENLILVGSKQLLHPEALKNSSFGTIYIANSNLKKGDFPDNLHDRIDWQTKLYF
jgi:hypothetical protein